GSAQKTMRAIEHRGILRFTGTFSGRNRGKWVSGPAASRDAAVGRHRPGRPAGLRSVRAAHCREMGRARRRIADIHRLVMHLIAPRPWSRHTRAKIEVGICLNRLTKVLDVYWI